MKEVLKIIVEKQVNVRELVVLYKRQVRQAFKKYNSTKCKERKLTLEEFDLVFDSIVEVMYEQSI